jgi:glycosyltransferase involved in cell wall biosynthesis
MLKWMWYSIPIHRSNIVTAISKSTRDEILRLFPKVRQKVRVVYCPLPPGFVAKSRVSNREPRILQIGTSQNKNINRVAVALEGLGCEYRIIGPLAQDQVDALRKSRVRYSNAFGLSDNQVLEEYVGCDLVLLASTYEGFGMPIIEGQAVGRPVVTGRGYSMPEVAGAGAEFVDPFCVEDIRRGVLKVLKNEDYQRILVKKGFENCSRFDRNRIALEYAQIYREIAGTRREVSEGDYGSVEG